MTALKRLLILLAVAGCLLLIVANLLPVSAAETIQRFDADIVVETDGAVAVTEVIAVSVEGNRIKRGIFRDIPVGSSGRAGFDVIEVLRNGAPERYAIENIPAGVRIRIGDPNKFLERSVQVYTIRYRMADQVGYTPDHDEIYWNVTGNGWEFPIERVQATVILPPQAQVISAAGYTGRDGSTEQSVAIRNEGDRVVTFTATRALEAREGMTIAVSFPKGLVVEPGVADRALRGLYGETLLIGLGGLVVIFTYYMIAWVRVGRDPKGGPIIARWESDLPPAAMRYLDRGEYDSMTFTTAIVSMAAKGWITIEDDDEEYTLRRRDDVPASEREPLSTGEQKALDRLFEGGVTVLAIKQSNHGTLQRAQAALRSHFSLTYSKKLFTQNRGWFIAGILMTVVLWLAVAWNGDRLHDALFLSLALSFVTFFCLAAFWTSLSLWRVVRSSEDWANVLSALVATLVLALVFTVWVVLAGYAVSFIGYVSLAVLVLAVIVNMVFFKLLEARTPLGRSIADEIEGMRLYLTVAEKDRLAFHHPPERTPEHFEKLLPYAIALGVEDQWAQQFSAVFDRIAAENNKIYRPTWYRGDTFRTGRSFDFSRSFGGRLISASASPPPPNSAAGGGFSGGSGLFGGGGFSRGGFTHGGRTGGSFGGGRSGGGGGGGGGGGW